MFMVFILRYLFYDIMFWLINSHFQEANRESGKSKRNKGETGKPDASKEGIVSLGAS